MIKQLCNFTVQMSVCDWLSDKIVLWFVFYSEDDYKATSNLIYGVAFETSVLAIKVFFLGFKK